MFTVMRSNKIFYNRINDVKEREIKNFKLLKLKDIDEASVVPLDIVQCLNSKTILSDIKLNSQFLLSCYFYRNDR